MGERKAQPLPPNPAIIFMGTPGFAVPALTALLEGGHEVRAVVTQPDRPKGRGRKPIPSPIKEVSLEWGVPVHQPEHASDPLFCEMLGQMDPDLFVVVAFGQLLRRNLLEVPRGGVLNIHASLLPKYRGAAPIQWAIWRDEPETGLTAMRMDEGLDTGPILLQEKVAIGHGETAGELHDRLAELAGPFLLRTLEGLIQGRLKERDQDPDKATYAQKIDRAMGRLDWNQPAGVVSAHIRAMDPWPGAFTTHGGDQIKLFRPRVKVSGTGAAPGSVIGYDEDALCVAAGEDAVIIGELQLPGRRRLPAGEVLRGYPLSMGAVLGT
jgi:methionyl-tRNA formyltransferase